MSSGDGVDYTGNMIGLVLGLVIGTYVFWRFIWKSIYVVRHSEVMIVERFGKFKTILRPGVHFVWPIIESPRVVHWRYLDASTSNSLDVVVTTKTDRVDMREHLIDLGNQTVITVSECLSARAAPDTAATLVLDLGCSLLSPTLR